MLSYEEREAIRQETYTVMADVERQVQHAAGSYEWLCVLGGSPVFCHTPAGPVLRHIHQPPRFPFIDCGLGM